MRWKTWLLVATAALLGCDGVGVTGDDRSGVPDPRTREEVLAGVDQLAADVRAGLPVSDSRFDDTLEPLRPTDLATWSEADLRSAASALLRLRGSIVDRWAIVDTYCGEDSGLVYAACGIGYLCATRASLMEVRCLWPSASARAR